MKRKLIFLAVAVMTSIIALAVQVEQVAALTQEDVPRIGIDDLKRQMTENANLAIIDVRTPHDWEESTTKIRGAIREDASKIGSWIDRYPRSKTIVLYCK